jgi:hypothetical protein
MDGALNCLQKNVKCNFRNKFVAPGDYSYLKEFTFLHIDIFSVTFDIYDNTLIFIMVPTIILQKKEWEVKQNLN